MQAKSQSQVGTALQVYFNLGILAEKVQQVTSDQIRQVVTSLRDSLDPKKIEAAVIDQLPAAAVKQQKGKVQANNFRYFLLLIPVDLKPPHTSTKGRIDRQ